MSDRSRRRFLAGASISLLSIAGLVRWRPAVAGGKPPVLIGLDGEFGHASSTSAEAIKQGILIAVEEINGHGG
ncbi:MAG: hypothetical protein JNM82_13995, partial [Rhodocyclaceae bacterium]|nr:hypothetical protein [Rhodocyclaceae bacterium]